MVRKCLELDALPVRLIVDRRCSTRAIALVGGAAATCVGALLIVAGGAACGRAPDGGAPRADPARAGVTPLPSTPVPTGPAPAPEPWPQYRADAGKTGYTRSSTNFAAQPRVLWQVPFLDRVGELGPALAEASPGCPDRGGANRSYALVSIVPSGPGYVGTFELTVVAIADGFGIPRDSAFALGLLVHVMILATTTIGGVAAMIAFRRRATADQPAAERLTEPGGEPAP